MLFYITLICSKFVKFILKKCCLFLINRTCLAAIFLVYFTMVHSCIVLYFVVDGRNFNIFIIITTTAAATTPIIITITTTTITTRIEILHINTYERQ